MIAYLSGQAKVTTRVINWGVVPLLLGIGAVFVPTLRDCWAAGASADNGSQIPFVLVTGTALAWRDRAALALCQREPLWPVALWLALLVPAWVGARILAIPSAELLAAWGIAVVLVWLELGRGVLRRVWFVAIYPLFLATPSNFVIDVLTRPLRLWLSTSAARLTGALGLDVGTTGSIIQVDGYQLQVATACSGVNSLIGIAAIGLFYVYLRRGAEPAYAAILCLLLVPVAIMANLLRIVMLIVATHLFGDTVVDGLFHPMAGLGVFALAVALLFAIDALLYPVLARRR